jgi:hypothetical protein
MAAVRAAKHRGRVSLKLKAYALIVSDGMRFKSFWHSSLLNSKFKANAFIVVDYTVPNGVFAWFIIV